VKSPIAPLTHFYKQLLPNMQSANLVPNKL